MIFQFVLMQIICKNSQSANDHRLRSLNVIPATFRKESSHASYVVLIIS